VPPQALSRSVDLEGELLGVSSEERSQVCVVVQGVGAGELVPGSAVPGCPGPADGFGLFGFDRAGREAEFALGDAGPGECGGFLSFAVVEGGLDWSWD
jgi:hypothetical protein